MKRKMKRKIEKRMIDKYNWSNGFCIVTRGKDQVEKKKLGEGEEGEKKVGDLPLFVAFRPSARYPRPPLLERYVLNDLNASGTTPTTT